MKEWFQTQIDNGFADLQGLQISGVVPVKQELLNKLLALALESAKSEEKVVAPKDPLDVRQLSRLVTKAEVEATAGSLVLKFEVRR
jgi:hypothetical protein